MTTALYPYQKDAFGRFMERGSLLLALDTGLGKTLTAIAIAEDLLERREVRRVLLVVPANLKLQWARSLARFTDLPVTEITVKRERLLVPDPEACVVVDGTPAQRRRQYARARSAQYVITGYDQVTSDWREIVKLGCGLVVLDEASLVKSPAAQRSKAVKRHLRAPYRLALTATPVENRPEEVYSIMQWVDPAVLGRHDLFDRAYIVRNQFGAVVRYRNLDVLHGKLGEAMFRRSRADPDVAPFLPGVDYDVWRVGMDGETAAAYKEMARDLLAACDQAGPGTGAFNLDAHYAGLSAGRRGEKAGLGRLMSVHLCMEMLLAHPVLVKESAHRYLTTADQGSRYAADLFAEERPLPSATPKLDFLAGRVAEVLDGDPAAKVMVFTFFKGMLPLMAQRLRDHGFEVTSYDGDMTARDKEASVARFTTDPAVRVFLSSHAGAYGVDMPAANWLVNYDIPRSAGRSAQINGRHVRASSEFGTVHVRDVVVAGTIEDRNLARRDGKGSVSAAIVDGRPRAGGADDLQALREHAEAVVDDAGT